MWYAIWAKGRPREGCEGLGQCDCTLPACGKGQQGGGRRDKVMVAPVMPLRAESKLWVEGHFCMCSL